jgi:wobble nucleotide-excising tRNase
MIRRFKNITSLLLLLVFILPSIVKAEHHHEQFECKAQNEKHLHILHERCGICNFEFSVFLSKSENVESPKENPLDNYSNNYNSRYYSNLYLFSFSLRGPPVIQI